MGLGSTSNEGRILPLPRRNGRKSPSLPRVKLTPDNSERVGLAGCVEADSRFLGRFRSPLARNESSRSQTSSIVRSHDPREEPKQVSLLLSRHPSRTKLTKSLSFQVARVQFVPFIQLGIPWILPRTTQILHLGSRQRRILDSIDLARWSSFDRCHYRYALLFLLCACSAD